MMRDTVHVLHCTCTFSLCGATTNMGRVHNIQVDAIVNQTGHAACGGDYEAAEPQCMDMPAPALTPPSLFPLLSEIKVHSRSPCTREIRHNFAMMRPISKFQRPVDCA